MTNKIECQQYSRVTGYIRPISSWNPGKQQESNDRSYIKTKSTCGN